MGLIFRNGALKIMLAIGVALQISNALAQDAATDYVIPPSPEAASLGKYAQTPVGFYTGVPKIDIPLWTLTEGDISVPVSLSYHTGGHKVDEIAPRTGMGWVLNAGGVITRTIMGEADEYGQGGFLTFAKNNTPASVWDGTNEERFQRYENIIECADAEPDQFVFNFNGYSGKFAFNWNGQIVAGSETKVKIEPVNMVPGTDAFISEWRITTDNGMVYTFSARETTDISTTFNFAYPCQYRNNAIPISPVTSWYLSRIDSPNGNVIFFEYEPYSLTHRILYSQTISHRYNWSAATLRSRTEIMTTKGQYLKKITTASGNTAIEIVPSGTPRTDIPGTTTAATNTLYSVAEIRVHTREQQNARRFKMGYDYSIGRLCLRTVQEIGSDGLSANPPYTFTYTGSLPAFSANYAGTFYSQDHWGFYNGANNSQLIPSYVATSLSGQTYRYGGANRAPGTASLAGLLTQIKYPTGGTTTFQFENHNYSFLDTTPIKRAEVLIGGTAYAQHTSKNSGTTYASQRTEVGPFTIKPKPGRPNELIPLIYNVNLAYCSSPGFAGATIGPRITIFNANHISVGSWHHTPNASSYYDTLMVLPGEYTLEAYAGPTPQCTDGNPTNPKPLGWDTATGSIHWLEFTEPKRKDSPAGGARIRKIIDHDGMDASRNMVREFKYTLNENGQEVSSGVLQNEPKYSHEIYVYESTGVVPYAQRVANSYIPLGMTQGSPIGYKQVTVFNGENGQGGKTEYYYKTFGDAAEARNDILNDEPPFAPAVSMDYKRGLLSKQIDYAYNYGSFSPVRQLDYEYVNNGSDQSTSIFALKVGENCVDCRFGDGGGTRGLAMDWRFFSLGGYAFNLAISRLAGVTETLYADGRGLVTTTTMAYDGALQFLLKEAVKTSAGTELITEYIYPFSFNTAPSPINQLKTKHMLSPVIEKINKEKTAAGTEHVIGASLTQYGVFAGKVLPSRSFQLAPDAPLTDFKTSVNNTGHPDSLYNSRFYREVFTNNRYTTNGHLEESTTPGNVKTSYIWGHHRSAPIARISNAAVNQCAFSGFESADNGNWYYGDIESNYSGDARTGRRSFKGNTIWTTVDAGRYVVSLWAKGSGQIRVNNIGQEIGPTWKRYQWTLDAGAVNIEVNGNLIDDLRLHPASAQMKTFTYTPLQAISSVTDENNETVFYEYDALGRLLAVKDQDGNIIKHYQYNYKD